MLKTIIMDTLSQESPNGTMLDLLQHIPEGMVMTDAEATYREFVTEVPCGAIRESDVRAVLDMVRRESKMTVTEYLARLNKA
jgi:hypothetical protein